jgi:hypothetical protein
MNVHNWDSHVDHLEIAELQKLTRQNHINVIEEVEFQIKIGSSE